MIDTIVLILSKGMYHITDPDKFQPVARWALSDSKSFGSRGYFKSTQNPTKSELLSGNYKPRLTLTNRYNHEGKIDEVLKIEFSVPKLLFKNNFDELVNSDFDKVIETLQAKLKDMGVKVFKGTLINAPVSAVHYSKNIPLTDGSTPRYLISKIKEANISLALDINQTDYRNEGHSYKWHANSYEVAFYDKILDLTSAKKKGGKRAIENDNNIQLGLFESLSLTKQFEVLRMEVRLNKRQKITQLFGNLGIDVGLTFKNLFDTLISQKVLLHYLNELEARRLPILDYKTTNPKELLAELIVGNPQLKMQKTLQVFGLKQALSAVPPRELRAMFGKQTPRSWYRLISEAKGVKIPSVKSPLEVIRKHLVSFETLKLVDFQREMLNNDKYK